MGDDGGSPVFTGYRGKYGMVKTNIVTSYAMVGAILGGPTSPDGMLFIGYAEPIAEAWINWGKADPRYMKIVQLLWGGPYMTLLIAHGPLVAGVAANHGINIMRFLSPVNMSAIRNFQAGLAGANQAPTSPPDLQPEVPPLPYQPVGPMAPTEDAGPPPTNPAFERVFPDEGIPADIDVQLREAARRSNIPYDQLRDAFILQSSQQRIAEQTTVRTPRTLGEPVTNIGA